MSKEDMSKVFAVSVKRRGNALYMLVPPKMMKTMDIPDGTEEGQFVIEMDDKTKSFRAQWLEHVAEQAKQRA
jgi:antitoxin component of MazEF toxin-antitoxin module